MSVSVPVTKCCLKIIKKRKQYGKIPRKGSLHMF